MSAFKPCGHSALQCMTQLKPCCDQCDHGTYWRELDDERYGPWPVEVPPEEFMPVDLDDETEMRR